LKSLLSRSDARHHTPELYERVVATDEEGDGQAVSFRPYAASDFEAVADLWTRVNWELAPVGMEALFEQYIATTIAGELPRLPDIFSQAKRNAFWVVELAEGAGRLVAPK
jgi:hypothetical protein